MKEAFSGHRKQTTALVLFALTLRIFLALAFPHVGGDSPIYEAYARNLLRYGVYSHLEPQDQQPPAPTLTRPPGYPLFLAALFALAGQGNEAAVRLVQALLDTLTCVLIAVIVFDLSQGELAERRRRALWALLLAALCPFVANYAASILAEVPTTFLLTAATLFAVHAVRPSLPKRNWFFCGLSVGLATLFRVESGLWLVSIGLILVLREAPHHRWRSVLADGLLVTLGLALALFPWTVRNLVTLKTFQPLAPAYAQDPDEFVPRGYYNWCRTWLWRFRDVNNFIWTVQDSDIPLEALPGNASDTPAQREKILALLSSHNESDSLDSATDSEFQAMARERSHQHPFRVFVTTPFLRALALWFTPRIEILPLEGRLLPMSEAWENDPRDFLFSLLLFLINLLYLAFALVGVWRIFHHRRSLDNPEVVGACLLLSLIFLRTAFLSYFAFPEPRYVVEVFPEIIALGGFAFAPRKLQF
ncbi:MAG: glycosyltransferase family 39 protein [Acidobacteriia bacterium]|nr:glycosyltransferase family 39 protein [Terriglobia bacterium]